MSGTKDTRRDFLRKLVTGAGLMVFAPLVGQLPVAEAKEEQPITTDGWIAPGVPGPLDASTPLSDPKKLLVDDKGNELGILTFYNIDLGRSAV